MYDVSPIIVTVNDRPPSFLHFMVRMCAVVGGVFAVTRKCGTCEPGVCLSAAYDT